MVAANINLLPEDLRGRDEREREAARKRAALPVSLSNPAAGGPRSVGSQPKPSLWSRLFRRQAAPKPVAPKPITPARELPPIKPLPSPIVAPVASTPTPAPVAPVIPPPPASTLPSFIKPEPTPKPAAPQPTAAPAPSFQLPSFGNPVIDSPKPVSTPVPASWTPPKPPKLSHPHLSWWQRLLGVFGRLFPAFGGQHASKPPRVISKSIETAVPVKPTASLPSFASPASAPTPAAPSAPTTTSTNPADASATPDRVTEILNARPAVTEAAPGHLIDTHPIKERSKFHFGINLMPKDAADAAAPDLRPRVLTVVAAAVIAIALVGVLYLALTAYQLTIVRRVKTLQAENAKIDQQIKSYQDTRRNAETLQRQLIAVKASLERHVYWTKFFQLLERATVADVSYQGLAMAGTDSVALQAVGRDFNSVAQQLVSFERATTLVRTVTVNGATAKINSTTGQIDHVEFVVNLELQPTVFLTASSTSATQP